MNIRYVVICWIIILAPISGNSQANRSQKKTYYLDELIVKMATRDKQLPIQGDGLTLDSTYTILSNGRTHRQDSLLKAGGKSDSKGNLIVDLNVRMENPKLIPASDFDFRFGFSDFLMRKVHFMKSFTMQAKADLLLDSCEFEGGDFVINSWGADVAALYIGNCRFNQNFVVIAEKCSRLFIYNNEFNFKPIKVYAAGLSIEYFKSFEDSLFNINNKYLGEMAFANVITFSGDNFTFENNKIINEGNARFEVIGFNTIKAASGEFTDNVGPVHFLFSDAHFVDKFVFKKNEIKGKINFYDLIFPQSSQIEWNSVRDQLCVDRTETIAMDYGKIPVKYLDPHSPQRQQIYPKYFYHGNDNDDLLNSDSFERLFFTYKRVRDTYIERGDLQSSNEAYVAMKDLQGRRLEAVYNRDGGLKNWLSFKLNRLMKVYTEHGTDPAKAIVISIWVVFGFGIFYFFFPSDWDVTSKSRLVSNFKDFITKNEKGYFKPFVLLMVGFVLSLINAFTLSLNSFTTLGFGNIPTHGIARYVCVVQGFIGWFLLSIFTVALINQVLA